MTKEQLQGAVMALEKWGSSHYDSIQDALKDYRAQLAAMPEEKDPRDAALREVLEAMNVARVAMSNISRIGHHTGYDWNADPAYLTLAEGDALQRLKAALARIEEVLR